jgi:hypothetical protein
MNLPGDLEEELEDPKSLFAFSIIQRVGSTA